eukprot:4840902-Karenia_brevis.AAC.1
MRWYVNHTQVVDKARHLIHRVADAIPFGICGGKSSPAFWAIPFSFAQMVFSSWQCAIGSFPLPLPALPLLPSPVAPVVHQLVCEVLTDGRGRKK